MRAYRGTRSLRFGRSRDPCCWRLVKSRFDQHGQKPMLFVTSSQELLPFETDRGVAAAAVAISAVPGLNSVARSTLTPAPFCRFRLQAVVPKPCDTSQCSRRAGAVDTGRLPTHNRHRRIQA